MCSGFAVVDAFGPSIRKAKIAVRRLATKIAMETSTNAQGLFPPVANQLMVSATGFSGAEVNQLLLEVVQQ